MGAIPGTLFGRRDGKIITGIGFHLHPEFPVHRSRLFSLAALAACSFVLAGCGSQQIAAGVSAAPALVAVAKAEAPQIAPDVDIACKGAVAGLDAAAACTGGGAAKTVMAFDQLAHAGCDTPEAKATLTANDAAPLQPDGGSASWLTKIELAGAMAAKAAPYVCALVKAN
jgi:hypothetical protein